MHKLITRKGLGRLLHGTFVDQMVLSCARAMSSVEMIKHKNMARAVTDRTALAMSLLPQRSHVDSELKRLIAQVNACAKRRDVGAAFEVLRQAEQGHLVLNNAVLGVCAKAFDTQAAWGLWEKMEDRDVVSYTIMLNILGSSRQIESAEDMWREMVQKEFKPNIVTYTAMVNAYGRNGNIEKALATFSDLKTTCAVDGFAYLAAMSACARVGDYARTRELFIDMIGAGIAPKHQHLNSLITACVRHRHGSIAEAIFRSFPEYGMEPRVEDFTSLISSYIDDVAKCRDLLQEMKNVGLQPSNLTLQELIEAELTAGNQHQAVALIEEARALGAFTPKLRHFAVRLGVGESSEGVG